MNRTKFIKAWIRDNMNDGNPVLHTRTFNNYNLATFQFDILEMMQDYDDYVREQEQKANVRYKS